MSDTFLEITTGKPGQNLRFNMVKIYDAERRLPEIRGLNASVAADLKFQFLEAQADVLKYLSTIRYQFLLAKRNYDVARATALLDKFPDYAASLKEDGRKENEAIREAFLIRDADVLRCREIMESLDAIKVYMENKEKTLDRAYWECKSSLEDHNKLLGNRSHSQGSLESSSPFMPIGQTR